MSTKSVPSLTCFCLQMLYYKSQAMDDYITKDTKKRKNKVYI